MMAMEKKDGSLNSFAKEFCISRTALYKWVNRYRDELVSRGILTKKRKGGAEYWYVKDIDEFIDFFKEKGVYLVEE